MRQLFDRRRAGRIVARAHHDAGKAVSMATTTERKNEETSLQVRDVDDQSKDNDTRLIAMEQRLAAAEAELVELVARVTALEAIRG
jgi:hypothetical protein